MFVMNATSRLSEKQVLEIIKAHYKAKNIEVKSVRIARYETSDPRETSYGYVEIDFAMPEP